MNIYHVEYYQERTTPLSGLSNNNIPSSYNPPVIKNTLPQFVLASDITEATSIATSYEETGIHLRTVTIMNCDGMVVDKKVFKTNGNR